MFGTKFIHNLRCPKCGGNLYIAQNDYGYCMTCLQCGLEIDVDRNEIILPSINAKNKEEDYKDGTINR